MKALEEFDTELCVFELRYSPAYLLWDGTGSIWYAMLHANPELKLSTVQPNQQVFETDSLQMVLELAQMRVMARGPDAVEEVKKNASALLKFAADRLKIDAFSRAGFRLTKTKVCPSAKLAMAFVPADDASESRAFGTEASRTQFVKSAKYESEQAGLLAILRAEEREWNFNAPWESRSHLPKNMSYQDLSRKEWTVTVDSDYFTIGTVDRESFDVETWINQAVKSIQLHWSES